MRQGTRFVTRTALVFGLAALVASGQKPPTAPPPAPTPPANPAPPSTMPLPGMQPPQPNTESDADRVLFLLGHVASNDGSALPMDLLIERFCNNRVRQQVHASPNGDFSMELGSINDSIVDASGDQVSPYAMNRDNELSGIPRRELFTCELRASASGFNPRVVNLAEFASDVSASRIDVGTVLVDRLGKVQGATLSATPYKAPKDARRAFEKGLSAENAGKLAEARKDFESAVTLYPKYTSAWYELGTLLQRQKENDAARHAFSQATASDPKFLPPYLSLAALAFEAENWSEVLVFAGQILARDPYYRADVTGYVVDLDALNYAEAYFYNAVANYRLNRIDEAEKSALKAEHVDLRTTFPQLHLLLAEIFARKKNYESAISELQTYLELAPQAGDAEQVRAQLVKLEKLKTPAHSVQN